MSKQTCAFTSEGDVVLFEDGDERWRTDVTRSLHAAPFRSAIVWDEARVVVVGGAAAVVFLDAGTGALVVRVELEGYFGSIAVSPVGDQLLVLSSSTARLFDRACRLRWCSAPLAVDGLLLEHWREGSIGLSAEHDPPGGWRSVAVDPASGAALNSMR